MSSPSSTNTYRPHKRRRHSNNASPPGFSLIDIPRELGIPKLLQPLAEFQIILHLAPYQSIHRYRLVYSIAFKSLLQHLVVVDILVVVFRVEFDLAQRHVEIDGIDDLSICSPGAKLFNFGVGEREKFVDPLDQFGSRFTHGEIGGVEFCEGRK